MIPSKTSMAGLRSVALFEAAKGAVVILAGCGLLALVHHDLQATAERLVEHLHLNPAKRIGRIFLEAAAQLNDARLRWLALGALLYAAVRFIEAYGLWHGRRWAAWFGVVSGGIYLPFEVLELCHGFAWLKVIMLAANLIIVLYLVLTLRKRTDQAHG